MSEFPKVPLTTVTLPGGVKFSVHKDHADKFRGFVSELEKSGYTIDPKTTGGYNPRYIAGTRKLSNHAYGTAVDINWNANARGSKGNLPANVGEIAAKYGLRWGGTWKNPDPMHFEVASGGVPAATAAAPAGTSVEVPAATAAAPAGVSSSAASTPEVASTSKNGFSPFWLGVALLTNRNPQTALSAYLAQRQGGAAWPYMYQTT